MSAVLFILNVIATIFLLSALLLAYSIQVACNKDSQNQSPKVRPDTDKLKNLIGLVIPKHSDPGQQKALRKLALVMWGCFIVAVVLYFVALLNMDVSLV